MIKKIFFTICILFIIAPVIAFAQITKLLSGKIIVTDGNPKGVLILNLNSEKETKSDFNGNFTIEAKSEDLLVFQSENLEYLRKSIEDIDVKKGNFTVKMTVKNNQLDEIKIFTYPNINALSLGILTKPAKTYTLAERRLYNATSGGGVMLLMNALNGKTKMLKRYVAFEKIETRTATLIEMFESNFYIKTLSIPEGLVGRFIVFAAEEEAVIKAMRTKNKFLISFELVKVAQKFNKLQHEN
jgi:hypothetical protein